MRIVYHVAGDIWILDSLDAAAPRKLDIDLSSPPGARAAKLITASDHLGDLDCDETGKASVVEVRGTVHWLTHTDGPARALSAESDGRARLPRLLGTDRQGRLGDRRRRGGRRGGRARRRGIDAEADGRIAAPVTLAAGQLGSVSDIAPSPDGTTVAVGAHDGRLLLVSVESGEVTELAASDDGDIDEMAWSPDSAWLAWAQPGPQPLSRIRLARVADRFTVDVTDGRFADSEPVFTGDGLYLAFLSRRTFDPVYDAHSFDLSFPFGSRPYLVPLAAGTLSPFGPLPGGRPVSSGENSKDSSPERTPVTVDTDHLSSRVISGPGGRGQVLRPGRGQGRPGLAAVPAVRRARRGRGGPRRGPAAAGARTVRPAQARGKHAGAARSTGTRSAATARGSCCATGRT